MQLQVVFFKEDTDMGPHWLDIHPMNLTNSIFSCEINKTVYDKRKQFLGHALDWEKQPKSSNLQDNQIHLVLDNPGR